MRKGFFLRLAADNLKKNRRSYLPYLLSCIGTVAMFYIMLVLSKDTGIESMRGAEAVQTILMLGNRIVGIFAVIFLFYTNSFLLKNRKKERSRNADGYDNTGNDPGRAELRLCTEPADFHADRSDRTPPRGYGQQR